MATKGIYKRKNGRFEGRFQLEGKRYSITGKTVKEVQKKMNDKRYELEHGMYAAVENITVESWFYTWIDEYKKQVVKDRTLNIYTSCYRVHIKSYIGKQSIKNIRSEHIQKIFNELAVRKGLSKGTLGNVKKTLNGMFEQAVINDMLYKNPVRGLKMPKTQEKEKKKVLTATEQEKLLESAKDNYYYDLIVFALNTGMRIGEITGLKWSDIDYQENVIKVRRSLNYYSYSGFYTDTPKTKSSTRDIPMTQSVIRLLKNLKKKQLENKLKLGSNYKEHETIKNTVFTSETGGLIHEQMFNKALKKLCVKCDIEPITPHALRHTFATRCSEKGMKMQTLKGIMGHTKIALTMDLYSHVLNEDKQQEIKLLEN